MNTTKTYPFSDMFVMLGRSMRHIFRSMDTIITVAVMPIAMMLLFVYVFGGAMQVGTSRYVDYLLPGILLIAIANGVGYTASGCFWTCSGASSSGFAPCLLPDPRGFGGMCCPRWCQAPSRSS